MNQDNARAAAAIGVEQRHRDAAANLEPNGRSRDQILRGKRDSSAIVQAFARFEASLRPATETAKAGERIGFRFDVAFLATLLEQRGNSWDSFEVRGGLLKEMIQALIAPASVAAAEAPGELGWIVSSADGKHFRCWDSAGPAWTDDPKQAIRYARRIDAESVHAEDEDAWRVIPFDELAAAIRGQSDKGGEG